jgi:transcriptional regulator with XRE-family HTH domain
MPSRSSLLRIGSEQADLLRRRLAAEVREMRLRAGLSQADLARAAGVSRPWLQRFERGKVSRVDLDRITVVFAILGHKLVAKPYPTGEPLRDVAHVRLLGRFNARVSPHWRRAFEVPMPIPGDLRAWDERLQGQVAIGVEAETNPSDLQAIERAIALKVRDSHVDRAILLVASTRANRELVRLNIGRLRHTFPLDTRATLAALAAGRDPGENGLVIL